VWCRWDKPGGFIGMEAALTQKGAPLNRRLVQVMLTDPSPLMYHGEVVYRDGAIVGDIRAASYGHTLGGAIGLSMVEGDEGITAKWVKGGTWEVDVAGTRYPAVASLRPMLDPKNERIKR
jgi:glycine cleavage system aminomethyltransferase T